MKLMATSCSDRHTVTKLVASSSAADSSSMSTRCQQRVPHMPDTDWLSKSAPAPQETCHWANLLLGHTMQQLTAYTVISNHQLIRLFFNQPANSTPRAHHGCRTFHLGMDVMPGLPRAGLASVIACGPTSRAVAAASGAGGQHHLPLWVVDNAQLDAVHANVSATAAVLSHLYMAGPAT